LGDLLGVGLSTRGTWVLIPAKARRGICEQVGVAIISRIAYGSDLLGVGLSTRGTWVLIPAKARRGICEQDTDPQVGVARISRIACGSDLHGNVPLYCVI
jgi:hypothetical protein